MFKYFIKKFMRLFVILTDEDRRIDRESAKSILILDSGTHEHLRHILFKVRDNFPPARISVLTFYTKEEFIKENFPDIDIILPDTNNLPDRYKLSFKMPRLKKRCFDCVILMSLDITSVIAALVFMRRHVKHILLYNRWDETYLMRFRTLTEFLSCKQGADVKVRRNKTANLEIIWKVLFFIPDVLINIGAALYLFFSVVFVFVKKHARQLCRIGR